MDTENLSFRMHPRKEWAIKEIIISKPTNTINGHGYVDLGLPSGTLWATMNVGAPELNEDGNHYSWGETQTKNEYKHANCRWEDATRSELFATGVVDKHGNLTADYDAATVLWGKKWRMPTSLEIKEILSLQSEIVILDGKYGRIFFGRNGNTIFLPCKRDYTTFISSSGYYWSSTIYGTNDTAYRLYFGNNYADWSANGARYAGLCIRAVVNKD